jgi:dienelactone hydrolase
MSERPETNWPGFLPSLEFDLSESPVEAKLPSDITIEPPAPEVAREAFRWSGIWSGWAGQARVIDVKLVVESVSATAATVICIVGSEQGGYRCERIAASLFGNELHGRLATGTVVTYRMRNPQTVEMFWQSGTGRWIAGVLSQGTATDMQKLRVPTKFVENDQPVSLEMVIAKPKGDGPFPTLLFNHGSTGFGNDPASFRTTSTNPALARFFVECGWLVAFPQRRGRGKSDGRYGEGLASDGSGYSHDPGCALAGFERALEDLAEAHQHLLTRFDVDSHRLVIGGQSRGGALAVAYAGEHTNGFDGVLNFVGGWLGDQCTTAREVNGAVFRRGACFDKPTLWLYANNDPFYTLAHSRKNFESFTGAGGRGSFHVVDTEPFEDGHHIIARPDRWGRLVSDYLLLGLS